MCNQCQTKPVYEFTNQRKLCKTCFIKWFEKKFLYTIRKFQMIQKNDVIGYERKNDFKNVVLESLLKMFTQKSLVELVKLPCKSKINKIAISFTTDLEAEKFVHVLIKSKTNNLNDFAPIYKKTIKPLYLFLDKEVLLYAKLKNLKFKKIKIKQNKISSFINDLEKKHPEIKHSIVNSYLKLEK